MFRQRVGIVGTIVLGILMLVSGSARAQGTIAGAVRDTTGAVMPGVTVEASSDVLIEKVRSVVTDTEGLFKIIDLRPGQYAVTFTLPGFATVRREGIELAGAFTATVNAEMRVGSIEENITVSGAAPMVDTQRVVTERVVQREVINAIPTGTRSFGNLAVLIPGVTTSDGQDVGGTVGYQVRFSVHNGRTGDTQLLLDGLSYSAGGTTSGRTGIHINDGMVQEVSLELGGMSAESPLGGVVTNMIPREGSNKFRGTFFGVYSDHNFQSDNLTDELKASGLTAVNSVKKNWDLNPSFGGAIRQDRLWFYSSFRYWGTDNYLAGIYYNKTINTFYYTPDFDRQADTNLDLGSENLRLTWQATPRNKLNLYYEDQQMFQDHYTGTTNSPESTLHTVWTPNYIAHGTWTSPVTSRLLLTAGMAAVIFDFPSYGQEELLPTTLSVVELSTNFGWGAASGNTQPHNLGHQYNYRASASYVTGSHAVKVGMQFSNGWSYFERDQNGGLSLGLLNGVPSRITQWATPFGFHENLKTNLGIYAQDQWRLKRLTFNIGARFDYINVYVPAQHALAGPFVPARDFDPVYNVPNWKNASPRFGVAYDLFGTGKTALKGTVARYLGGFSVTDFTRQANPIQGSQLNANRTWNDTNQNLRPDCDLTSLAANGECGALSNRFGLPNVTSRYDAAVTSDRPFNWEMSAGIQHELRANISLDVSYFRRAYGNLTTTDNLAVTPVDYSPYCITSPVDSRLPDGGGSQICGMYDINPSKFGQVDNLITFADLSEVYDGLDVNANVRLPKGIRFAGGLSTGRTITDSCVVVDSPQALKYCRVSPPFQPQVKFYAVYPLPWDLQTSVTYQGNPGPQITASYTASNSQIAPSLGRNLSAGVNGTATVPLVEPGTMYAGRLNQFDYRLTKIFRLGSRRIQGNVDMFNVFNASPILSLNTTYGPQWQRPTNILQGRVLKFGVQVDF